MWLSFVDLNDVILEIFFQTISEDKYSFSDPKTYSLVKMAEKVVKQMLQFLFMDQLNR